MDLSKTIHPARRALILSQGGPLADAIGAALQGAGVQCGRLSPGPACDEPWPVPDSWPDILVVVQTPQMEGWKRCFTDPMEQKGYGRVIHVTTRQRDLDSVALAPAGITENAVLWNVLEGVNDETSQARELMGKSALGRGATPGEIAAVVAFLASSQAGYITGVHLPVTGGYGLGLFPEQLG